MEDLRSLRSEWISRLTGTSRHPVLKNNLFAGEINYLYRKGDSLFRFCMKKVLIITYYWPPSGGAGVQRWLKFAKYLPEFGWQPVILTVDPKYASYPQRDESLLDEVDPSCMVYSTKSFELYNLYKFISGKEEVPYGGSVSYTHLRAHETRHDLVCRLLLEKKKK